MILVERIQVDAMLTLNKQLSEVKTPQIQQF
jgi:hypothetical protein